MVEILDLNDETFEAEVLHESRPVLVDFGAEWCKPCKQLDPIVEELAQEWGSSVKIVKLDIDENVSTTMKFSVMGVPTLMLFVQGEPVERLKGFLPKQKILAKLSPHLP